MDYSVKIIPKRIKQVPKFFAKLWVLLLCSVFFIIVQLCNSRYQMLENLPESEINIEQIYLLDSHDTKGSRMKLEIVSGKKTYYVWYPQSNYLDYAYHLENDLLSGNVTSVIVKIPNNQSIHDNLFHQTRVVDIRSDSAVYYDLNTELISMQHHRFSLWILLISVSVVLLCYSFFISLIYGVMVFKK